MKNVSRALARGAVAFALAACPLLSPGRAGAQQAPASRIHLLSELDIPDRSLQVDGTLVGGLSGLAYDARRGVYYAISDDRGEFAPARFYTLRIDLAADGFRDIRFTGVTLLDSDASTPGIQPYDTNDTDTEEIVLLPDDTLLISSERDREGRPWIRHFALDGSLLGELPLPDQFNVVQGPGTNGRTVITHGVRTNVGFEGVTLAPDEDALYLMNEEALAQDGPLSTPSAGTTVRLLRMAMNGATATPTSQAVYRTEKIFAEPIPPDQFADNGISSLTWIRGLMPEFDFLALERSFATGVGTDVNLYGLRIAGADDVSDRDALGPVFSGRTVDKTLLVNIASLGVIPDNLEGMVVGPRLPDGRTSLILVSDDNFSDIQTNQFLLFAVDAAPGK